MEKGQRVSTVSSDIMMNKFKGLLGTIAVIHNEYMDVSLRGCEIDLDEPVKNTNGQKRYFFTFDKFVLV